jgi:hypothetical protein
MSARLLAVIASAALVCIGAAHGAPVSTGAKGGPVYRWVDENGIVHYGDSVPPQYSQQESAVLNNQGVEVGHRAAQKSAAEFAEEARQQQQLTEQKQRDSFLLSTYTSVKDIEQLRDERLEQLRAQRLAAQQYVASLRERLLVLQERMLTYKPYNAEGRARRMPDELAQDVVHALNEMRTQGTALAAKDREVASTRAQFQADIDRYRELHTPGTASTASR